jgi:hypothetical protein
MTEDVNVWLGRKMAEMIAARLPDLLVPMKGYDPGRPLNGHTRHVSFYATPGRCTTARAGLSPPASEPLLVAIPHR